MAIRYHPDQGTIVICDFKGFVPPEMIKRRPAVVVSPRFRTRNDLCSVVPLSTTAPSQQCNYHFKLAVAPPLPAPFDSCFHWVKADMVYTVSLARLDLPFSRKDAQGKRIYDIRVVDKADLESIQKCILHGLGLSSLTQYV